MYFKVWDILLYKQELWLKWRLKINIKISPQRYYLQDSAIISWVLLDNSTMFFDSDSTVPCHCPFLTRPAPIFHVSFSPTSSNLPVLKHKCSFFHRSCWVVAIALKAYWLSLPPFLSMISSYCGKVNRGWFQRVSHLIWIKVSKINSRNY